MSWVVFLRAVNVGGTNRCRPAAIARKLAAFGVVNIGAVGTFVVRAKVSESRLRAALAGELPFPCEIMICPADDLRELVAAEPFARQAIGQEVVGFVSVLAKRPDNPPRVPFGLPSDDGWGVRVIALRDRFLVGLYRREMKAISHLGKLEKVLGVPGTVRNWNTIERVARILEKG